MYCSTCGARLVEGRSRCDTCGAAVQTAVSSPQRAWSSSLGVSATCPRCGYRGEGVSYFSRGSHVALAVGLTLLTAGAMGAGGLVYYLVRREHVICPRCGRGWGKNGMVALVPANGQSGNAAVVMPAGGGNGKQAASILLFILAAILVVVGLAASEIVPMVIASVAGSAGIALFRSATIERQKRREALLSALQLPVLQLAGRKGGQLTVTEVAAELGWTMRRAEKVLQSMDDGLRVTSDVTDEGVIVYEFPELTRSSHRLPRPEV